MLFDFLDCPFLIFHQKNCKTKCTWTVFPSVYNLVSAMEDLCVRIPLVAGMILKNLDNQSLMIYKESSRGIHQYLTEGKLVSIRIIKEYKKSFLQFQNVWEKVLKKASVKIVQEFATLVQEFFDYFNPRFPTERHERREKQWHPLWMATLCGNLQFCKYIIEKTGDANPVQEDGLNPLHIAALYGYSEIYQFLRINLSHKNPLTSCGRTPFHFAAQNGHLEVCRIIMIEVADKNPRNLDGVTPLHIAAGLGHLEVYKLIIKEVADKNPKSLDGVTPLHLAAKMGHLEIYKLIIKEVADKNPRNRVGNTPLHMAASKGNLDVCKYICQEIDNKNPQNNSNRTPLQMAYIKKHWLVVQFLIAANNLHKVIIIKSRRGGRLKM